MYLEEQRLRALFIDGLGGDAVAYRSFLRELRRHLRYLLGRKLPQLHEDVEDLVQDILIAVHTARHTYRTGEPVTAWIRAIASYKLMDFFRRRARCESLHDSIDDHQDIFSTSGEEPADARSDIGKLLGHLPHNQRLSILHVKLQGFSVAEAAGLIGLSEAAVRVSIHRGLRALSTRVRRVA